MKALTLILFVILLAVCCTFQKHIVTDTTKYDSTAIRKADSLSLEINKLTQSYEKLKTEAAKTKIIFQDVPCPDVKIDSSCNQDSLVKLIRQQEKYIKSLKNTVKVNADGSYSLQGQVKEFQVSLDKVEKETNILYVENVKLKATNDSLAVALNKSHTVVDRKVKRSFLTGWWVWVLFFVAGYAVRSKTKLLGII